MTDKIHLTFPPRHTDSDVEHLLEEYRKRFPESFENWVAIEKSFVDSDKDPLRKIAQEGLRFFAELCQADSTLALSTAWYDVRRKVIEFAKEN